MIATARARVRFAHRMPSDRDRAPRHERVARMRRCRCSRCLARTLAERGCRLASGRRRARVESRERGSASSRVSFASPPERDRSATRSAGAHAPSRANGRRRLARLSRVSPELRVSAGAHAAIRASVRRCSRVPPVLTRRFGGCAPELRVSTGARAPTRAASPPPELVRKRAPRELSGGPAVDVVPEHTSPASSEDVLEAGVRWKPRQTRSQRSSIRVACS